MSELPTPETDIPAELDHGELFRPSSRHLAAGPMKPRDRTVLLTLLAAAAGAVALLAVLR